jgi:uncharacterized iron-regulated membrane protein
MAAELLVAGLIVILVAVLARLVWMMRRREGGPVTETQARENAAPLSTAILVSDRRKRTR